MTTLHSVLAASLVWHQLLVAILIHPALADKPLPRSPPPHHRCSPELEKMPQKIVGTVSPQPTNPRCQAASIVPARPPETTSILLSHDLRCQLHAEYVCCTSSTVLEMTFATAMAVVSRVSDGHDFNQIHPNSSSHPL